MERNHSLIDKYKKELIRDIEAPEFNYLEANEFTEASIQFFVPDSHTG